MLIVACLALATLGGLAFALCYGFDLGTEALGASIGGAFAFVGLGLAIWSQMIDDREPDYVEERAVGPSTPEKWESFEKALTTQPVPRVKVLWGMLGMAVGSIGLAALFPLRSLFPKEGLDPQQVLTHTRWKPGQALITEEGDRIKPDDLDYGGVLTAYPAGLVPANTDESEYNADAVTLLIRVQPELLKLPSHRKAWVIDGVVGYSKLSTHAGCPVGLYADEYAQLLCPCHHSIFDVLHGAVPVDGPAARPLPQLPLTTDADGYLVALGDFTAPTGAAWWGYQP